MPYKKITQKEARRMKRDSDSLANAKRGGYVGPGLTSFDLSESGKAIFATTQLLHDGLVIARYDGGSKLRIIAATTL